jgi:proteasome lid subunit RPN8/RPN11
VTEGSFDFFVEVTRAGELVESRPASAAACLEDALFRSVVAGLVPNDGTVPPHAWVPEWSGDPPSVTALALELEGAPPERYAKAVFGAQAAALLHGVASRSGSDEETGKLAWRLQARAAAPRQSRFSVRTCRAPWPLEAARLEEGPRGEVRAEIEAALLHRLREETVLAGNVERAWLLLGRVLHDSERGVALVHALRAISVDPGPRGASETHFAFGPETWLAARGAVDAAGGLALVGWAHTHPPCERCPSNPECEADTVFFSGDDREVQAAAFPSPYMLALVAGKLGGRPATEPGFRLFGWQRGEVRERDFRARGAAQAVEAAVRETGGPD